MKKGKSKKKQKIEKLENWKTETCTSCKISKKSNGIILSNIQKVDFWTKNQQKWRKSAKREFSQKWSLEQFVPFNAF